MKYDCPLKPAVIVAAICWLLSATPAIAQLDRLYPKGSDNPVTGTAIESSKNGIKFKTGANTTDYIAGDIEKVLFQGDPSELTKGRQFALDGQYQQALQELKAIQIDKLPREVIKADVAFYTLWCESKLALEGRGDKTAAAKAALAFANDYKESWHFYDVAKLLGDLALALNNPQQALKYYQSLLKAPSTETKIESVYLVGLVQLSQGDAAAAQVEFDKVIGVKVAAKGALRLQTLAKAGKAVALAKAGKGDDGLKLVDSLIAELNPTDVEMAARIYNAQGASYEATGDREGAILAYLHTHLMFSSQPDAHAEALVRLVALWPQVGKPERAAEARQELQDRYPGYGK